MQLILPVGNGFPDVYKRQVWPTSPMRLASFGVPSIGRAKLSPRRFLILRQFFLDQLADCLLYTSWPIFIQVGSILGPGIIGEFSGLDDVANIDGVYEVEQVRRVGDAMTLATSTLSQIGAQIKLQAPASQTLRVRLQRCV